MSKFKINDIVKDINTNNILIVLENIKKDIMRPDEVKCKVLKSVIKEDKNQIFEYNINYLELQKSLNNKNDLTYCYCKANNKTLNKLIELGLTPNRKTPELGKDNPNYYVIEDINNIWASKMKPNSYQFIELYENQFIEIGE